MTPETPSSSRDRSLRLTARMAGALNVLSGVPDGYSVSVLRKVVVRGDAAATAAAVLHSETTFRLALVADLFALLIFAVSAVLLYETFRPAGRRMALVLLILLLMGTVFQCLACIQDFTALLLLKGGPALAALPVAQANALAFIFLRLHWYDYQLALLFDGFGSLTLGFLVLRSRFVPRVFAPFMWIDGLGYVTFVLASFVAPALATRLYPYVPFGTTIGEAALFLWLIIRSVKVEPWREQAAATAQEGWA